MLSGVRAALLCLLVVGATAPSPVQAQEERADSLRMKVRERLQRLGRAPGADSVLFIQDSIRAEEARLRGPGSAGSDSIASALLDLGGYTLTQYQAGSASFAAQDRLLKLLAAEGSRARVDRDGNAIEADTSITYDEASGRVITVGASTFTPQQGDPVDSDSLVFDIAEARGSAFNAKTEFNEGGGRWNVVGDMPYASVDSTFMSHAQFTSCELEEPHYHFATDQIKIVGGNVLVARPVRLYFGDVPVAWLPFVAQSLSTGRASGLLTPRFSVNDIVRTSGGYRRRVSNIGFYWAMSDYSDALVAMDWFSDNFFSLTGSMNYRFNNQFLDGGINLRQFWRANGSSELALDTRHSWEFDERTQFRLSGRYASSNDFVRENSFNPAEVTQSIDSEGGANRRFDWGSLSVGANRKQYLSDDRTEWTLPSANLSLSTITLFRAPSNRARFFNNMTWSGGANFSRRTIDRIQPDTFAFSMANTMNTTGSVRSNLSLGNLSLAQSIEIKEASTLGVPEALLIAGDSANPAELLTGAPARDIARADLNWSTSLDYQQQLIGSTTLTPSVVVSGNALRSDTSSIANNFVAGPARVSLRATLKTDIYGFMNNVLGFEAIRHKFSPSFQYEWSPETKPTPLQEDVFGSRALQPKNALSITVNQTWEAKRASPESEGDTAAVADSTLLADSTGAVPIEAAPGTIGGQDDGPQRAPQSQTINLLALRTSVVRYDFVEADEIGSFLSGFETTRLSNQISSDFLRGLSLSVDHDLFEEESVEGETQRSFAPHLSQVNLSFQLGSSSTIFRWLSRLAGRSGDGSEEPAEPADPTVEDPFASIGPTDEASIVPTEGRRAPISQAARGGSGGWSANLSYSLQRPRLDEAAVNQMLTGTVTLRPTQNWDLSWRTAYDLERNAFNDHTIRLSRDLHRWKANFDFLQTATGNWTFRFEVSLIDNSDLKFDYQQRNLDVGQPTTTRR